MIEPERPRVKQKRLGKTYIFRLPGTLEPFYQTIALFSSVFIEKKSLNLVGDVDLHLFQLIQLIDWIVDRSILV